MKRELKRIPENYMKDLAKRGRESKIYTSFQSTGIALAKILRDSKHKAIYIRLAKIYDNEDLIRKAKTVAEKRDILNMGAYFMKLLKDVRKINHPKLTRKTKIKKPKNLKLNF